MNNTLTIHQYFRGMRHLKKYSAKDVANVLSITADDLLAFENGSKPITRQQFLLLLYCYFTAKEAKVLYKQFLPLAVENGEIRR